MRQLVTALFGIALLTSTALAAGTGPEIRIVDNKFSIQAPTMTLGRLLHLFDLATGMKSKVPAELVNRSITVQFSGLDVDAAVAKIFEGQMLDYVFIGGHGIVVTAISQPSTGGIAAPPPSFEAQPGFVPDQQFNQFNPLNQEVPGPGGIPLPPGAAGSPNPFNNIQGQPAMIQTPFGPIPNPRLNPNQGNLPPGAQGVQGGVPFGGGATPFGQPGLPANPFGNANPNAATTTSSPGILPSAITPVPLSPQNQQLTK